MKTIAAVLGASLALVLAAQSGCASKAPEEPASEGSTTTEEVRDEFHYVLARCTMSGDPLARHGKALASVTIDVTLGKRDGKRAVTYIRADVKTATGEGDAFVKVVATAENGGLTGPYGTFLFVGDEEHRGKLKVDGKSTPLDYLVVTRVGGGRSFVELGKDTGDPVAHAADCTIVPEAWRVTEDPSCINLLGGNDVEGKRKTIAEGCFEGLDEAKEEAAPEAPDAGRLKTDGGPPSDAGPSSDAGSKGAKDPPLPEWPEPGEDRSPSKPGGNSAADENENETPDAGTKKKAKPEEGGGCTITRRPSEMATEMFLLALLCGVLAVARRRSAR